MSKNIIYLYDPLCGWCYGATPALSKFNEIPDVNIEMLPSGLFSGEAARPMDDYFATFAWENDQRIASLTGQRFTERYREFVLGNSHSFLDSGPATLALTAVWSTYPKKELEALYAIQCARFIDGQDITDLQTLENILKSIGLEESASKLISLDMELILSNRVRINSAQALMKEFSVSGVPTFIAESGEKRWHLKSNDIYTNSDVLISELKSL